MDSCPVIMSLITIYFCINYSFIDNDLMKNYNGPLNVENFTRLVFSLEWRNTTICMKVVPRIVR